MRTYVVAASTFWRTYVGVSSKVGSKVGTNQHMSKVGQPAAACLLVLSSSKKGREKKPGVLGRPAAVWLPLSVFFFL